MASKRKKSNSVLIGKKKYTIQDLQKFSLLHYYYINQLLGDQTLRAVIMEEFPHKENRLVSEKGEGDFANSSHHLCILAKNNKWCSVDEGIQNLNIHSHDTLCQSYSVLRYFGGIGPNDKTLTKKLQMKMIKVWHKILENRTIMDQIHYSVTQTKNKKFLMKGIPKSYRESLTALKKKIVEVLQKWKEYGYVWFMLNHCLEPGDRCSACDAGVLSWDKSESGSGSASTRSTRPATRTSTRRASTRSASNRPATRTSTRRASTRASTRASRRSSSRSSS